MKYPNSLATWFRMTSRLYDKSHSVQSCFLGSSTARMSALAAPNTRIVHANGCLELVETIGGPMKSFILDKLSIDGETEGDITSRERRVAVEGEEGEETRCAAL